MSVRPHPRFGIGAILIRDITLRYPNVRFHGDKLFSNEQGIPIGLPASRYSLPLFEPPCGPPFPGAERSGLTGLGEVDRVIVRSPRGENPAVAIGKETEGSAPIPR